VRKNGHVEQEATEAIESIGATALGLVFLGGTLGVFGRELLTLALSERADLPIGVLVANLVGSLLLGLLLRTLEGSQTPRAQRMRLLFGTGVLGGFTTYSALALAVTLLLGEGEPWFAFGYGLGTLLAGGLAMWAGIGLGGLLRHWRVGSFVSDQGLDDE
jgi:CrcB protein